MFAKVSVLVCSDERVKVLNESESGFIRRPLRGRNERLLKPSGCYPRWLKTLKYHLLQNQENFEPDSWYKSSETDGFPSSQKMVQN